MAFIFSIPPRAWIFFAISSSAVCEWETAPQQHTAINTIRAWRIEQTPVVEGLEEPRGTGNSTLLGSRRFFQLEVSQPVGILRRDLSARPTSESFGRHFPEPVAVLLKRRLELREQRFQLGLGCRNHLRAQIADAAFKIAGGHARHIT